MLQFEDAWMTPAPVASVIVGTGSRISPFHTGRPAADDCVMNVRLPRMDG